jgi:AbrB family looped-hinge helix DNA binding protein
VTQVTSLTRKGQVTIPKHVRDQLGLRPFDKIEMRVENGEARLRKARLTLDEIAGSLPPIGIDPDEAVRLAKQERAERSHGA